MVDDAKFFPDSVFRLPLLLAFFFLRGLQSVLQTNPLSSQLLPLRYARLHLQHMLLLRSNLTSFDA